MNSSAKKAEIIIYQSEDKSTMLDVRIEEETVWLTQLQMVELFQATKQNISLHINNIFKEGELKPDSTVKEYLTVQTEGKRQVKRNIKIYNLDVIISVGYRVKSKRGTQFRIWANKILKDYLLRGYILHQRIEKIENLSADRQDKIIEHDRKFEMLIKSDYTPNEGIFYDGQVFDAYIFASQIIKSAKKSIVLIDNYIDETVLTLLSKRKKGVDACIYSANITQKLKLDIEKFNTQYPKIEIKTYKQSHDRFLIIDNETVYHIGASLKDLGKKWFAFSKINIDATEMIKRLNK